MRNDQAALPAVPGKSGDRVPFNDLLFQWREISTDVEKEFSEVFARSAFSAGPFVEAFERDVATYLRVRHAVAVNSGTSALHLAMVALGIGVGDEVLVPAHTFIGTLWGPLYVGAKPVLCDVESDTATIDVADAERRINARTRAIIPVHLYGQPANIDAVIDLAGRYGLAVVEDNAHAFGARWNSRQVGTYGKLGCFSFYPSKNLGAAGEGGLVSTDDDGVAKRVRSLHNHGQNERHVHELIGFNYRMDGLQGVILRHKLRRVDHWTAQRKALAKRYQGGLAGLPVEVPVVRNQDHVWHLFVIRTPQRDALKAHLQANGIETGLHYPIPNHRQPCLRHLEMDRESFPVSDRWAQQGLSLPLFCGMTIAQLDRVVQAIREFFKS